VGGGHAAEVDKILTAYRDGDSGSDGITAPAVLTTGTRQSSCDS
jgi:hypothetical protein